MIDTTLNTLDRALHNPLGKELKEELVPRQVSKIKDILAGKDTVDVVATLLFLQSFDFAKGNLTESDRERLVTILVSEAQKTDYIFLEQEQKVLEKISSTRFKHFVQLEQQKIDQLVDLLQKYQELLANDPRCAKPAARIELLQKMRLIESGLVFDTNVVSTTPAYDFEIARLQEQIEFTELLKHAFTTAGALDWYDEFIGEKIGDFTRGVTNAIRLQGTTMASFIEMLKEHPELVYESFKQIFAVISETPIVAAQEGYKAATSWLEEYFGAMEKTGDQTLAYDIGYVTGYLLFVCAFDKGMGKFVYGSPLKHSSLSKEVVMQGMRSARDVGVRAVPKLVPHVSMDLVSFVSADMYKLLLDSLTLPGMVRRKKLLQVLLRKASVLSREEQARFINGALAEAIAGKDFLSEKETRLLAYKIIGTLEDGPRYKKFLDDFYKS